MFKKIIILCLALLSGCGYKTGSCILNSESGSIYIDMQAKYDNIYSFKVKECIKIPYSVLADKDKLNEIIKQIDKPYVIENNYIVFEYDKTLDKNYSLIQTMANLKKENFNCE